MAWSDARPKVRTGIDVLLEQGAEAVKGKRVGLLVHPASVTGELRNTVDRLASQPGVTVRALFGPEHGIGGERQDQEHVDDEQSFSGERIPVYSLYKDNAASLTPTQEMLKDIDVFVVDLQDVGIRYYTFVYTMSYCMEACRRAGIDVIVLDRPNPLGGTEVEGNIVEEGYRSFVGGYPVPVRHGMTIGELASMFNDAFGIGCSLEVIPMRGWERWMWFDDTGLPWVMPSPNMPSLDTATVYGGSCLFEGTNISEGRGTTRPFEILGAPWIESDCLCRSMNSLRLPGVYFRPHRFCPVANKWSHMPCGGLQIHVTDRALFKPFSTGMQLLYSIYRLWPEQFQWRKDPYEFEVERLAIDLLAGGTWLRQAVEHGTPVETIQEGWKESLHQFMHLRQGFLRY